MVIRASKKCDVTTEPGGSEDHPVHFEEINHAMLQPEGEFHLETSNDKDTDSSPSENDPMSSSDEDNESTPESYYFVAHNLCITKEIGFKLENILVLNSPFKPMVCFFKKLGHL